MSNTRLLRPLYDIRARAIEEREKINGELDRDFGKGELYPEELERLHYWKAYFTGQIEAINQLLTA